LLATNTQFKGMTAYTKSGLATPVINQSAQADFVCVAAILIASSKGGYKGGFGIIGEAGRVSLFS